jgi:formamidopyrimidine-DNA glycosylase
MERAMPELPEVEVLVRSVRRQLNGAVIRSVSVADKKLALPPRLAGQKILRVWRRAKFLVMDLSGGGHLLAHMRMTGWIEFQETPAYRVKLVTDRGAAYFTDRRRLGFMKVLSANELKREWKRLGPEPLDSNWNLDALGNTSRPVKVALMDQQIAAGVGNIYASESLWRAMIRPERSSDRLSPRECQELTGCVRDVLKKAIRLGERIFEDDSLLAVYGREGQPCRRRGCAGKIRRIVQAGRSTYFCPVCQR